jgi:hypothetical protein
MAACYTFVCSYCRYSIEAWDDGNPYFLSDKGRRQYFYHPGGEEQLKEYVSQSDGKDLTGDELNKFLEKRTGNMSEMLCLDCGRKFRRDLERQKAVCPSRTCKSANIIDTWELEDKQCPKCKQGQFKGSFSAMS